MFTFSRKNRPDFTLKSESKEINTHVFMLTSFSKFFDNYFNFPGNENSKELEIDMPYNIMHIIIKLMYNSSYKLKKDNTKDLNDYIDIIIDLYIYCDRYMFHDCIMKNFILSNQKLFENDATKCVRQLLPYYTKIPYKLFDIILTTLYNKSPIGELLTLDLLHILDHYESELIRLELHVKYISINALLWLAKKADGLVNNINNNINVDINCFLGNEYEGKKTDKINVCAYYGDSDCNSDYNSDYDSDYDPEY